MELLGLIRTAARSLRHDGFCPTVDLVVKNLVELWRGWVNRRFDWKHDVDTSRRIELSDLDIDSPNRTFGVYYEPTPIKTLRRICLNLPRDLRDFVLVDFGSGKGRVLLIASEYNFKRVIGVEFAKDLHRIAQRNVQTYRSRSQRCFDVESVCMDATLFPIPPEKCVFYFFNPFRQEVMSRVVENIRASHEDQPRDMIVVYYNPHPIIVSLIEGVGFLRKVSTKPLPRDLASPYRRGLVIYESRP